ncbi:MaoC domain-containing protein dehydratase [Fictibacillus macauensis ZFHKF-1]|uniref:MaoC domain-containing protein dehydratase n=1 Tax=Fictibacillus macauensis ZFHKF-1 TaxID=1196324 RepID=I8J348_9BACL|nr:hypothetical protein [Fictibacillus macauensis]EIT86181.1 MaoC domain-containing protein dehydratase [Fictibacillus macauensis ZFHKF-1]
MQKGDVFSYSRSFTVEEVLHFGELSGDQGRHHVELDDKGRLMVQGLLTASLGTKIGGDMHYIARQMNSEFVRPVFTGDVITCEVTLMNVEPSDGYVKVSIESVTRNQQGKEVLLATSHGIIRKDEA